MNQSDMNILEGLAPSDDMEGACAMQRSINGGQAWSFQGSYGRSMMEAIKSGRAILGTNSARDYYGNRIPARDEVKPGTKGSFEFVADRMGAEYANQLLEV